jgi:hypothetical protein
MSRKKIIIIVNHFGFRDSALCLLTLLNKRTFSRVFSLLKYSRRTWRYLLGPGRVGPRRIRREIRWLLTIGSQSFSWPRRDGRGREGDVIYETKAPGDAEAFAAAQTPEEWRVAYCHCPPARAGAATTPAPEPYCCCCGGWYGGIWEFIVERPVRVDVLRPVMRGDDDCTFAVHLPPGVGG